MLVSNSISDSARLYRMVSGEGSNPPDESAGNLTSPDEKSPELSSNPNVTTSRERPWGPESCFKIVNFPKALQPHMIVEALGHLRCNELIFQD